MAGGESVRQRPFAAQQGLAVAAVVYGAVFVACARTERATSDIDGAAGEKVQAASVAPQTTIARVEISQQLEQSCREMCDRSRRLQCRNAAKCLPNCLAMGSVTPCTDPILAMYKCLTSQPVESWECAPDGVAAIKAGFCDSEQSQAVRCMEEKMQNPGR